MVGQAGILASLAIAGALISALALRALLPVLRRTSLAAVNERSDHSVPTPQGGGIGIVTGLLTGLIALQPDLVTIAPLLAATMLLAITGAIDDRASLPVSLRLGLQAVAATTVWLSMGQPLAAQIPVSPVLTGLAAIVAIMWLVNAVNFIDGSDWLTLGHGLPALVALAIGLTWAGDLAYAGFAAALAGAMVGFAPFNRPAARLFLGDAGSLPIGLALGALCLALAPHAPALALVVLAYPLGDATLTLLMRWRAGKNLLQAHRDHAYQTARKAGWSPLRVSASVFGLQVVCNSIGLMAMMTGEIWAHGAALVMSALAVAAMLWVMRRAG